MNLAELSLPQRFLVAISMMLIATVLLIPISWLTPTDAQAPTVELYGDIPTDPTLLALDRQALDEAYHEQIKHLWSIWIKGQARSTTEITNGLRLARRAYGTANAQIEKRELQYKGDPK